MPSRASVTHGAAVPPFGPVRQTMLRNESETYTFPASSNVSAFSPEPVPVTVMNTVEAPVNLSTFSTRALPKSITRNAPVVG